MKINTTRFGELELDKSDMITFKEGLLGFDDLRTFLLSTQATKHLYYGFNPLRNLLLLFQLLSQKSLNLNIQ